MPQQTRPNLPTIRCQFPSSFSHLSCIHESLSVMIKLDLHVLMLIFFFMSLLEMCTVVNRKDLCFGRSPWMTASHLGYGFRREPRWWSRKPVKFKLRHSVQAVPWPVRWLLGIAHSLPNFSVRPAKWGCIKEQHSVHSESTREVVTIILDSWYVSADCRHKQQLLQLVTLWLAAAKRRKESGFLKQVARNAIQGYPQRHLYE